jgi:purine-binding chemotaxis protein CheW
MSESTQLYLTFRLADDMFAAEVSHVREILDAGKITRIPRSPDYMRGVINVRGSVVPVVDMRLKFGMPPVENTASTRIIVLELNLDRELLVLGALADAVKDVIELPSEMTEAPPRIGSQWKTEFIKGIGKQKGEFIILLDVDRIFSTDELVVVDAVSAEAGAETPSETTDMAKDPT